jgi:hypothetical protein
MIVRTERRRKAPADYAGSQRPTNWATRYGAALLLALLLAVLYAYPAIAAVKTQTSPTNDTDPGNPGQPANPQAIHSLFLPKVVASAHGSPGSDEDDPERVITGACPATSSAQFDVIPVVGLPTDRPPEIHADLNLSLRGYTPVSQTLALVDISGDTDTDSPQLANVSDGIASPGPAFVEAFQVNDWDWECQGDAGEPWAGNGCRGSAIVDPVVTLIALGTEAGSPVRTPPRSAEIYGGGYVALVLYAEEERLTLVYTREDTAANGYVIHLEGFCVDPALLEAYQTQNANGRSQLPGLHSLEQVGVAGAAPLKVAVRDSGSFLDPRSRKDWWKDY